MSSDDSGFLPLICCWVSSLPCWVSSLLYPVMTWSSYPCSRRDCLLWARWRPLHYIFFKCATSIQAAWRCRLVSSLAFLFFLDLVLTLVKFGEILNRTAPMTVKTAVLRTLHLSFYRRFQIYLISLRCSLPSRVRREPSALCRRCGC